MLTLKLQLWQIAMMFNPLLTILLLVLILETILLIPCTYDTLRKLWTVT